jgi:hypothetical protein
VRRRNIKGCLEEETQERAIEAKDGFKYSAHADDL